MELIYRDAFFLLFTQALEPFFSIYSSATAIARCGDSLAIAMVSYISGGKNAWNIGHCVFNRDYIPNFIHFKDALEQVGIRFMSNGQEETLYRQDTFLVRLHDVKR